MPELDPTSNNAAAWEAHYAADHTPWDHAAAHPMLHLLVEEEALRGRVLVPGCGAGHDVAGLAACGLEVLGIDLAPSAIAKAKGLYPDTNFEQHDLFNLPDAYTGAFDTIWEHTCFCAIHPDQRAAYVDAMHRCLKPDGQLVACLYITQDGEEIPGPPYKIPRSGILEYFTPRFTVVEQQISPFSYKSRRGNELLAVMAPIRR
ncbi:MAG: SAM-dependent methyltransferase [Kiritimatiellia bacterium]|jgi:SAM-dependent methyltransferase